jgi:BirA family biotin operon repressor/biotin-[acetyl-CoA-carboxylase] ligase
MAKLGANLLLFDSLPSTNDLAHQMAESGAEEGTTIVAREQTAGRGRQGRRWLSPAGQGLYLSLILRPRIKAADAARLTLSSAIAVAETLLEQFAIKPDIKWPNDILVRGRKICGILVECATEGESLQYAIVGIGINVAQRHFPDEIAAIATSVFLETGHAVTPDNLLDPLLDRIELWYRTALVRPEQVLARWEQLSSYAHGCPVRIISADEVILGTTCGLTASGALVVETLDGHKREITSGEVSLRRNA